MPLILRFFGLALALWIDWTAADTSQSAHVFNDVERVVAVGDVHGDFKNYRRALLEADLINQADRWIGGEAHLVQLGDIAGRGPDAAKIMRHLMELEAQAEESGGKVHVLIGNHEAMSMLGDLEYVNPKAFSALKSRKARALRKNYYEKFMRERRKVDPNFRLKNSERKEWNEKHPLGWVEHRLAWGAEGEFGAWTLGHPALLKINDTLFVHGGISPVTPHIPLEAINNGVREELAAGVGNFERPLTEADDSPLWYRGYAYPIGGRISISLEELEAQLAYYGVSRIVVGHTPGFGTILPRFDARVLLADTGISSQYGGYVAALEIRDGTLSLLQAGQIFTIPQSDSERVAYLSAVEAALDKPAKNLTTLIGILSAQSAADSASDH